MKFQSLYLVYNPYPRYQRRLTKGDNMNQLDALETYFRRNSRLTQHQATIQLGINRLAARIFDLEARGYVFLHNMIDAPTRYTKARVCQYILLQRPKKKV